MPYQLAILDKSPIATGQNGVDAIATTLAYARLADNLGYHRFWLAEHHDSAGLASAAPEIFIAHILAQTRRIRVGSGGILLQHYAPYKVAEVFSVLEALAPGRVDLGVGKSPGGFPNATRALQAELSKGSATELDRKLAELEAWLNHAHRDADIQPRPPEPPARFLLGGSVATAEQAAHLGWGFVHAGHQDGDRVATLAALDAYERIAGQRPALAVAAFAAPSRDEALDRVADLGFFKLSFADGHAVNLSTEAAAAEYAQQYGVDDYKVEAKHPLVIAGTGSDIRDALAALQAELGVSEFILDQPVAEQALRLRSVALIAEAAPLRAIA
jgi:luciferase family oxidoreductase group 1